MSLNGLDAHNSALAITKLADQLVATGLNQSGLDISDRWRRVHNSRWQFHGRCRRLDNARRLGWHRSVLREDCKFLVLDGLGFDDGFLDILHGLRLDFGFLLLSRDGRRRLLREGIRKLLFERFHLLRLGVAQTVREQPRRKLCDDFAERDRYRLVLDLRQRVRQQRRRDHFHDSRERQPHAG